MHDNIAKKCSKSLVIPTGKTTDHQIKSDRIVSNHLSSSNTHQFKIIAMDRF